MAFKRCLPVFLLLSVCLSGVSAQTNWENIYAAFVTDESSPVFGLPLQTCIKTINKLPDVIKTINLGKVTVLCPEDLVFTSINASNPFLPYIKSEDVGILTALFKYHIITSFWVADSSNNIIGTTARQFSQMAQNEVLVTALGTPIYGSLYRQQIQFSETKGKPGKIREDAPYILYPDQFLSTKDAISVQYFTGLLTPPADLACNIEPALCPSPPPVVASPPPPKGTPVVPSPTVPTPATPATPSNPSNPSTPPIPPAAAPAPTPDGAASISASLLLLLAPALATLLL